jgi:hypothetical protein
VVCALTNQRRCCRDGSCVPRKALTSAAGLADPRPARVPGPATGSNSRHRNQNPAQARYPRRQRTRPAGSRDRRGKVPQARPGRDRVASPGGSHEDTGRDVVREWRTAPARSSSRPSSTSQRRTSHGCRSARAALRPAHPHPRRHESRAEGGRPTAEGSGRARAELM